MTSYSEKKHDRHYVVDHDGIPLVWPYYECWDHDLILAACIDEESALAAERLLSMPDGPEPRPSTQWQRIDIPWVDETKYYR